MTLSKFYYLLGTAVLLASCGKLDSRPSSRSYSNDSDIERSIKNFKVIFYPDGTVATNDGTDQGVDPSGNESKMGVADVTDPGELPSINVTSSCYLNESTTLKSLNIGAGATVIFSSGPAQNFTVPACVLEAAMPPTSPYDLSGPTEPDPVPTEVPNLADASATEVGFANKDQLISNGSTIEFRTPDYGGDDLEPREYLHLYNGGFLPMTVSNLIVPSDFSIVRSEKSDAAISGSTILNPGEALDLEISMKVRTAGTKSGQLSLNAMIADPNGGASWYTNYYFSLSGNVSSLVRASFSTSYMTVPFDQNQVQVGITLTRELDIPITVVMHSQQSSVESVLSKVTIPAHTTHLETYVPLQYDCVNDYKMITMETGFMDNPPPSIYVSITPPSEREDCIPDPGPAIPPVASDVQCFVEEGATKTSYDKTCLAVRSWLMGYPVDETLIPTAKRNSTLFSPTRIGTRLTAKYANAVNAYIRRREKWLSRWYTGVKVTSASLFHVLSLGYAANESNFYIEEDRAMAQLEKEIFTELDSSRLPDSMKKEIKKNILRLNLRMASAAGDAADWVSNAAKNAKTAAAVVLTVDLVVAAFVIPVAAPEIAVALQGTGLSVFAGKVGYAALSTATVVNAVDTTKLAFKASFAGHADKSYFENLATQFNETTDARYANVKIGAALGAAITAGGGFLAPLVAKSGVLASLLTFVGKKGVPAVLTAMGGLQAIGSCSNVWDLSKRIDLSTDMNEVQDLSAQARSSFIDCAFDVLLTTIGTFASTTTATNPTPGVTAAARGKFPTMSCAPKKDCRDASIDLIEGLDDLPNLNLFQILFDDAAANSFRLNHPNLLTLAQLRRDVAALIAIRAGGKAPPGQALSSEFLAWEAELQGLKLTNSGRVYRQTNQTPAEVARLGLRPNPGKPPMVLGEHVKEGSMGGGNLISTSLLPANHRSDAGKFLADTGLPLDASDLNVPEVRALKEFWPDAKIEKTYEFMCADVWGVDTRSINPFWTLETEFVTNFVGPQKVIGVRNIYRAVIHELGNAEIVRYFIPTRFQPISRSQ